MGVAVSVNLASTVPTTQTVTWGGKTLTFLASNPASGNRVFAYLYYLKESDIASASGNNLVVTMAMTGASIYGFVTFAAVYEGVDQTTTVRNGTNLVSINTTFTTATSTANFTAGDQGIFIAAFGLNNTTATAYSSIRSGWTGSSSLFGGRTSSAGAYYGGIGTRNAVTAATGETVSMTVTVPERTSMSTVSLIPKVYTATTTALASSANPSVNGQSVTFTATVTAGATGTVNFYDGAALLGSGTLSGGSPNTATFATSSLSVATHSITATYAGDATYASSTSSAVSQVVNAFGTASKLVMKTAPSASVTAGATFGTQPAVYVQDTYGNVVTSDNTTLVTATVGTGTGPLTGTLTATASGGTATFSGLAAPTTVQTGLKLTFTASGLANAVDPTSITVYAIGTWLGALSTDWHTAGNWWGGIPTSSIDVLIPPTGGSVLYQPVIGASGAVCRNLTLNPSASLTISDSYVLTVSGNWANGGSFTAGTGTVVFNGSSAQTIGGAATTTLYNLTINNTLGVTASSDTTVNGVLNLQSANPSATKGALDMWDGSTAKTLTMGASATTVGAGDVTGIVTRNAFAPATTYTFGNQYTTIAFQNVGTLPTSVSVKIAIGTAPTWKTGAVKRTYDFIQTGGSGSYATVNAHYLDSELNGNTENKLVWWVSNNPFTPGTEVEYGRSNYSLENNWVGLSSVPIHIWATSFGQQVESFGDSLMASATWNGSQDTNWIQAANWTPSGVPSDMSDVVIPDASTTPNDPTLGATLLVGRLTLEAGAILNGAAGCTVIISGGSGAWSDNGGTFNPSTSTVIFANAAATISGSTTFYNVTINSGAGLTMGSGGTMAIGGTMINNGTWRAAQNANNTVEYNGGDQAVLSPNGLTPGYDILILSGSGIKTLPSTTTASGNVEINNGVVFNLSNGGSSSVGSLTIGGVLQAAGTWGSSSSSATYKNDTYFSGTGVLNVTHGTLDHFAISTIATATAGTPITLITLTAQDANNNPVPTFTGTVEYGGTAGIAGTSAAFTAGQLTGVSVTPTTAGSSKTFTITASSLTATATFDVNPGALDHFAISAIGSTQTAGTPITGITLTAQDAYNNTLNAGPNVFTGTVTYGGTAGITGTSASFTAGQLTGVSVTPVTAGSSRTFIVTGSTKTGTATFNVNPGAANATESTLTPTSASITANGSSTQVLTVQAKDANGNNLTSGGSTVTITKQSGTGTIGSVTDNGDGTYTATVTSPAATGSGVFVATLGGADVKSGTGSQTQATITYTPIIGTFQSHQTGDWNNTATWERWDGSAWVTPAPSAPTSADGTITIRNGHTVTVTANVTVDQVVVESGGQLAVNSGVTLILETAGNDLEVQSGGTLIVNGSLAPKTGSLTFVVGSGAILRGNGTIIGSVTVQSGGIVLPGNSVGTVTVYPGDFTFEAGSTNIVEIGDGTSCDKIIVGGNLTLVTNVPGVTLVIGTITNGIGHTIAIATNGLFGTFAGLPNGALVQGDGAPGGATDYYIHYVKDPAGANSNLWHVTINTISGSPTSSGIDLRAYQAADGVYAEFIAYDVEQDGTIELQLLDATGAVVWSGTVDAIAGPQFLARFLVPDLELGGTYSFRVRDEVGKVWSASGVGVKGFDAEMVSMSPAGAELSFDSIPGREYNIQRAAGLGGSWVTVDTVTASEGDTTTVVVPYPAGNDAAGFFRIQQK